MCTDGSKTDKHVGLGYTIIKNNNPYIEGSRRLPDEATVFKDELMAIKLAMFNLAGRINESDRYIKIFSDSRAAIQALNSAVMTCQVVKDTINALNLVGGKVE